LATGLFLRHTKFWLNTLFEIGRPVGANGCLPSGVFAQSGQTP